MKKRNLIVPVMLAVITVFTQSCKKEEIEPTPPPTAMMTSSYAYEFNNGQLVASGAYDGTHMDNMMATMKVEELSASETKITVTLTNTVNGAMYRIHAHDAADPNTTPNNTPYNETPNSSVFSQMVNGNGGTVSASQTISMSYAEITGSYNGFLVVHDPLQAVNTADLSTYLILGTFARMQNNGTLASEMFMYDFNTGQVAPQYAYNGTHPSNLSAMMKVQALGDGRSRVSVMLDNTLDGEMYHVHAHDAADPNTTPNGTPYNETPNAAVCTFMVTGNGGMAGKSQISDMSLSQLSSTYEGFFVVHDPLQAITTTDPTTYVLLGLFAR